MLDFISKTAKLEKAGLSSGKRRRKVVEDGIFAALEEGPTTRLAILIIFALCVTALVWLGQMENALFSGSKAQAIFVANLIVVSLAIHFQINHAESYSKNGRVVLMLAVIILHVLLVKIVLGVTMVGQLEGGEAIYSKYKYLLPPYAMAAMLMSILLGRNHGTFTAIYTSLLGAMLVPMNMAFSFLVISLVSGFVAVYLTHQIRRRSKLVRAGFYVGIATAVLAIAIGQIPLAGSTWQAFLLQFGCTVLVGSVTAMLVSGILPMLEGLFRITTDVSWIEMSDLNHPLLKRLTYEAPGTYHHSLVVARLSEAAADEIGANGTMCRVASYFHDIGKLTKPQYFIENIDIDENPHDPLTPTMSALIIVAHVKDGVDLALKHNLSKEIINVIREHHGTTLVQYFYHRALEQRREIKQQIEEGKANAEDLPVVDKKSFRYPGPTPRTRESAIISLADGIESASRSLSKPTPAKIEQLIDEITAARMDEGQLDNCDLTLADLNKIKKSFYNTLCGMRHSRISYPSDDEGKKPEKVLKLEVVEADPEEKPKKPKNVARKKSRLEPRFST